MSEANNPSQTGRIFEIQRFSIHDGPGIRTTVFFKGCPLRCIWCHNPEGMSRTPQLSFHSSACIGCGYCLRACARDAHSIDAEAGHVLDRERCVACGACTTECYAKALEIVGRDVTVAEVIDEALRDQPFYETSGGGLTLSGGEPTLQIEFARATLAAAKAAGLHCCVETCGYTDWPRLESLLGLVDLFLFDFKEADPERHKRYTGVSNLPIVANLQALVAAGARVRLRCPIVPGLNDRPDHFDAIAALARELPRIEGVELMPYHRLGEGKTERLSLDASDRAEAEPPDKETVEAWAATLKEAGIRVL